MAMTCTGWNETYRALFAKAAIPTIQWWSRWSKVAKFRREVEQALRYSLTLR